MSGVGSFCGRLVRHFRQQQREREVVHKFVALVREGSELSSRQCNRGGPGLLHRSLSPSRARYPLPPSMRPALSAPLLRKLLPNDLFRAQDLEKRLSRHVPAPLRSASLLWNGVARSLPATDDQQATNERASEPWIKGNEHSRIALHFVQNEGMLARRGRNKMK